MLSHGKKKPQTSSEDEQVEEEESGTCFGNNGNLNHKTRTHQEASAVWTYGGNIIPQSSNSFERAQRSSILSTTCQLSLCTKPRSAQAASCVWVYEGKIIARRGVRFRLFTFNHFEHHAGAKRLERNILNVYTCMYSFHKWQLESSDPARRPTLHVAAA